MKAVYQLTKQELEKQYGGKEGLSEQRAAQLLQLLFPWCQEMWRVPL